MKKFILSLLAVLSIVSCEKPEEPQPSIPSTIQGQFKVYEIQTQDSIYISNSITNQLYFTVDADTVTNLLWVKQEYQSFAYLRTDGVSFSMFLFSGIYTAPILNLKSQDSLEIKYMNPSDTSEYYIYYGVRTFNSDLDTLQ